MEQTTEPSAKCCAAPRANRKLLAGFSCVFAAFCWLSVVYALAVITLNWMTIAHTTSPDPASAVRAGIAGTIYQLLTGSVLACVFMWLSQITKLLLESAPQTPAP